MKRDVRFLSWHGGEISDPDECDCALGVIWDVSEDWATACRLRETHDKMFG